MKTYLITGGTGFLGGFLGSKLLESKNRLIFLARSKDALPAVERVQNNLRKINDALDTKSITVIEGDTTKERWGLSTDQLEFLRDANVNAIWHLAANLSFKERDRESVYQANVASVIYGSQIAKEVKAVFILISTTYVKGRNQKVLTEEELPEGIKFHNFYEESKFLAEKTILSSVAENGELKYIIFRPSVLIHTHPRVVSFFGYYAVVKGLYELKKWFSGGVTTQTDNINSSTVSVPLPFLYWYGASLNLMPVETATDWMVTIAETPDATGKIYHITNPSPLLFKKIVYETMRAIGIQLPSIASPRILTRLYLELIILMSKILPFLIPVGKSLTYYKHYFLLRDEYNMRNTIEIIGQQKIEDLGAAVKKKWYILKMAKLFIEKQSPNQ